MPTTWRTSRPAAFVARLRAGAFDAGVRRQLPGAGIRHERAARYRFQPWQPPGNRQRAGHRHRRRRLRRGPGAGWQRGYVRTAGMHIDALGMLRTGDGLPVLGNGGPIAVPPEEKVEIGQDGTISIRALGENPNVVAVVDRIKLVSEPEADGEGYRRPAALQAAAGRAGAAGRRQREGGLRFPGKQQRERGGRDDRDPLAVPPIRAAREDDAHRRDDSAAMARVLQIS